jgi:hypothetical protein
VLLGELKELGRGEAAVNHVLRGKSEKKRKETVYGNLRFGTSQHASTILYKNAA